MKKLLISILAASLLFSCGTTKTNTTKNSNKEKSAHSTPVNVALSLINISDDKVPVTINPGSFMTETVTYRLPKVVQGTYAVSDFGKYIDAFKAFDYKGNELVVTKIDLNSWKINNASNLDKITYLVNDTFDNEHEVKENKIFSPSGTNIDKSNYFLNLFGFVGYFDSLKKAQYTLDITAPIEFKKSAALQKTGSKKSADGKSITTNYLAHRYFDIADNPMMYGDLDVKNFKVGDIEIYLSIYSPNKKHTTEEVGETMQKMMEAQKAYMGDINSTPRYDIFLFLADGKNTATGFGALEHHNSTTVVMPEAMPAEALAKSLIDIVSHEFFHIITPLSVHSEDVHYFDYHEPTFSKHLWMYEGITEYFATLFQVNQGLVEKEEFFSKIMGKIQTASAMNDTMSFTQMSENVLEEPYKSQYFNVYQKGALIGMCLDIILREESNGQRGVLSLMKELSAKYGKNKPFNDDTLIAEITAMTYPSVGEFLNTHVEGTTPINYFDYFKKAGLEVGESRIKTNYIQNAGALIVSGDATGNIFFTNLVKENSFWAEQGVEGNDIIKSVNGKEMNMINANAIFGAMFAWQPGQDMEIELERDGKKVVIKTKLTQSYTVGKGLKLKDNATEMQKSLLNAWLKG